MISRDQGIFSLDGAAIGLSALCVIHCLALPLLVAVVPALGVVAGEEWVHRGFVILAVPVSLLALARLDPGRGISVMVGLLVVGLGLLIAGAFVEALEPFEVTLTVSGALILSAAHVLRWYRYRRPNDCAED